MLATILNKVMDCAIHNNDLLPSGSGNRTDLTAKPPPSSPSLQSSLILSFAPPCVEHEMQTAFVFSLITIRLIKSQLFALLYCVCVCIPCVQNKNCTTVVNTPPALRNTIILMSRSAWSSAVFFTWSFLSEITSMAADPVTDPAADLYRYTWDFVTDPAVILYRYT